MTTENSKRRLAAVLHADVKGYSRLMERNEEETVRTLSLYRALLLDSVEQYGGRLVDTAGDGFLAEFPSAVESLQFAVKFQEEIASRNNELSPDGRMEFRIGINVSEVVEQDGRIFGEGVNIAARLESTAEPGGICISATAYEQVKNKLDLQFENLGAQPIKNMSIRVRMYRVIFDPNQSPRMCPAARQPHFMRRAALTLGIMAVLSVLALGSWLWSSIVGPSPIMAHNGAVFGRPVENPDKPSVAVLPFVNMTGDPELDYFGDGISEEIITGLASIPQFSVVARNSSFVYKGKSLNVKHVARELGVRYVLTGGFRKTGDQVRITVQLIDSRSGRNLWAERYDLTARDILAVQDKVAKGVMVETQVQLTKGEQVRLWAEKAAPKNRDAHYKVLKAFEELYQNQRDGIILARHLFKEALDLDPGNSKAYAGMAWTHILELRNGQSTSPEETLEKARGFAQKALELNDSVDCTHFTLGVVHLFDRQYRKAIELTQKGVSLSPSGAEAHAWLGASLAMSGRCEEAVKILERAIRLSPMPRSYYFEFLGLAYTGTKRYDDAITAFEKGLAHDADSVPIRLGLAGTYAQMGRPGKAREIIAELREHYPEFSARRLAFVMPLKDQGYTQLLDRALRDAEVN